MYICHYIKEHEPFACFIQQECRKTHSYRGRFYWHSAANHKKQFHVRNEEDSWKRRHKSQQIRVKISRNTNIVARAFSYSVTSFAGVPACTLHTLYIVLNHYVTISTPNNLCFSFYVSISFCPPLSLSHSVELLFFSLGIPA